MRTNITAVIATFLLCTSGRQLVAQGTFVNLDFEATTLPTNGIGPVDSSLAFPGWSVYRGTTIVPQVGLNAIGGMVNGISLVDNYSSFPLSGRFNALFYTDSRDPNPESISLAQVGQLPLQTGLLQFRTSGFGIPAGSLEIRFDDNLLTLNPVSQGPFYTLWTADISAFAGQTGELRFTGLPVNAPWDAHLDDIMFVAVPEPSTWALLALGAGVFWWVGRVRRR